MKPPYAFYYSLSLVVLAHMAVLAAVSYTPERIVPVEQRAIQGVIIASEPLVQPAVAPSPPPEQRPLPKPQTRRIPPPRALTSESAPQVEQETPAQEVLVERPKSLVEQSALLVVPPQADASQFNNAAPVYPTQSRRLRETGVVILEVLVKADGSLGDMRLKSSSGYSRLDEAAQKAVKNWRFTPAKRGNEAIDFWYELPVEFSLNR
jgi:periplasmic protein TonB